MLLRRPDRTGYPRIYSVPKPLQSIEQRLAVGAIARHRLDGVRDQDDSRRQRYPIAAKSIGVTEGAPVIPLVVMANAGRDVREEVDRLEDLGADLRVLLDLFVLLYRQFVRLQ